MHFSKKDRYLVPPYAVGSFAEGGWKITDRFGIGAQGFRPQASPARHSHVFVHIQYDHPHRPPFPSPNPFFWDTLSAQTSIIPPDAGWERDPTRSASRRKQTLLFTLCFSLGISGGDAGWKGGNSQVIGDVFRILVKCSKFLMEITALRLWEIFLTAKKTHWI